jgi:hypothetical protein
VRSLRIVSVLVLLFALISCAKPLPSDRSDYVGAWSGPGIVLSISQEGRVVYRQGTDTFKKKISAPLKEFKGDNFVVGVGPAETTFVVTAPPRQVAGVWRMTVDGVELTRAP